MTQTPTKPGTCPNCGSVNRLSVDDGSTQDSHSCVSCKHEWQTPNGRVEPEPAPTCPTCQAEMDYDPFSEGPICFTCVDRVHGDHHVLTSSRALGEGYL